MKKDVLKTVDNILFCCIMLYFWALLAMFISLISTLVASSGKPLASSLIHFPLGYPGAIGIDQHDNLYYLDNIYRRLKVYDQNGGFLQAWFVPIGGITNKPQRLIIDNNMIYVETGYVRENPKRKLYTVYDPNGKIIERESTKYSDVSNYSAYKVTDKDGSIYKANKSSLFPKVTKTELSGRTSTIISDPFYLRIFAVVPNVILFAASILVGGCWDWWRKKIKTKSSTDKQFMQVSQ